MGQHDTTDLIGIVVLRIQIRDHIERMIQPFVFVGGVGPLPDHLDQAEPQEVGAEVMVSQHGRLEIFSLRKRA